jgi:predicted ATPase
MTRGAHVDVPQTTLLRIRAAVDAIAAGAKSSKEVALRGKMSGRHAIYAIGAARTLGLVESDTSGLKLTTGGRGLASHVPESEGERVAFRNAIRRSALLKVAAPELLEAREPSREQLARRLARAGKLAPGTADHRAGMLLEWRRIVTSPQERLGWRGSQGMWRQIEIGNFRSIERATVLLAPFSIVVGPNGSGKSNFADALVFARDVALDATTALSNRGGIAGVRRWRPSKPTDVSIDLRAAVSQDALEGSYVRHQFKIHSGKAGDWHFSQEEIEVVHDGEARARWQRRAQKLTGVAPPGSAPSPTASAMVLARQIKAFAQTSALRNVRRYRLNPDEMRKPQLAAEDTRLSETGDNIAMAVRSIGTGKGLKALLEPMRKIVPGLTHIYSEQLGRYIVLRFKQEQGDAVAEFNATEMSEGALRALGIVVATHQMESDELLIVEEPEVSIHSGAAELLFDLLKEASQRGAVLVTTHSADLLDKAKDEEILVCSYRDGATKIGPLAKQQREVVRQGLFSLAELMRSEPLRIEGDEQAANRPRKPPRK